MIKKIRYTFSSAAVDFYFDATFSYLKKIVQPASAIILTDENVYAAHGKKFNGWNTIVLKAGEEYKIQATVDSVVESLLGMEADRKTILVGVGGGVITDLTGYIASIYMRGIRFGFVPTSILALVDASIGGKNGIDVGDHKNLVGIIRQPAFILHDIGFLGSLPIKEWENGFAEVIKHGCIKDPTLFSQLEKNSLLDFQKKTQLSGLLRKNALIKTKVVQQDEFETGQRRLLNFGHTLGHALETQYELTHGQAISIGMVAACRFSEKLVGFRQTEKLIQLLEKFNLPVYAEFDKEKVFKVMKMDKKRERKEINYVLIEKIGKATIKPISINQLAKLLQDF